MKRMKKFISRFFDIICFVIGPIMMVFHLLSFDYQGLVGSGPRTIYYPDPSKLGIALGVALICIGILRKFWAKKN